MRRATQTLPNGKADDNECDVCLTRVKVSWIHELLFLILRALS